MNMEKNALVKYTFLKLLLREFGIYIITVDYENHPVKGKLTIYKKGEMLTGFKKDFVYEERYLKGASFHVYAAENIYTPDYQKDENGNRQIGRAHV